MAEQISHPSDLLGQKSTSASSKSSRSTRGSYTVTPTSVMFESSLTVSWASLVLRVTGSESDVLILCPAWLASTTESHSDRGLGSVGCEIL